MMKLREIAEMLEIPSASQEVKEKGVQIDRRANFSSPVVFVSKMMAKELSPDFSKWRKSSEIPHVRHWWMKAPQTFPLRRKGFRS